MKSLSTVLRNSAILGLMIIVVASQQSCKKEKENVIYSEWFTPGTYQKDTVFGVWGFKHNQPAPEITQQILDNGVILTYGKLKVYNTSVWPAEQVAPLPIQITYNQGGVTTDTWSALSTVGNLRIRFVNDKNIYGSIANTHMFRYVIIPGAKKATVGTTVNNNGMNASNQVVRGYEDMSYEEICEMFNIPR
jgi:hypothetical protein